MKNILSIDVEEIFQAEFIRSAGQRPISYRTPISLPSILKMLNEFGAQATFFVVGDVAERFPNVLRDILFESHEIGFHSYDHVPLWEKNSQILAEELTEFNQLLNDAVGKRCRGFRAPTFSLDHTTTWALDCLSRCGFHYDSSIFPAWTPLYGVHNAPKQPYKVSKKLTENDEASTLWEFPLSTYRTIPAAGGFYLRLMPSIVREAIRRLNSKGLPAVLYIDNWELDAETQIYPMNPYKKFVTYHNLKKTKVFLSKLLAEFEFTTFSNYLKECRSSLGLENNESVLGAR